MLIVFGCVRSGRSNAAPFAVGAWLAAAIIATPSSYANPAIAVAALFAKGQSVTSIADVALYVPAEVAGALIAFAVLWVAYPASARAYPSARSPVAQRP